ncbi:uncharacterized protein LOC135681499 isoform X2 [Rhopilema esculentum]|uniref:uncharacterized protein LOC135681499 isoform X2 n=1 Tax=Rhopilema esculentum TaxID=499914 RepID=UPI0031D8AE11
MGEVCKMVKKSSSSSEEGSFAVLNGNVKARCIPMKNVLDQETGMARHLGLVCSCNICCLEEMPIVAADGLLFRCAVNGGSYIPTEIVHLNELVQLLQRKIKDISERKRSYSASSNNHNKHDRRQNTCDHNSNMMSLFKNRSSSDSSPQTPRKWRDRSWSSSSLTRNASSPTLKTMPHSILLKCTDKQDPSQECCMSEVISIEGTEEKLKQKFGEQLSWVKENGQDFVALETLKTTSEISALLCVLAESKSPTLIQLKVNCSETITVSYHFLEKFRQEFMMLKVNDNYCMFMAPF